MGREETKAYFADDLVSVYRSFREQVYDPDSVLYPSCGFDGSPAKVFRDVTFVDLEEGNNGCIAALRREGSKALKKDIREYSPREEHDLLILLNSAIFSEWAARHVKKRGFIISNDYHGNATEMANDPAAYELWGSISFVKSDRRKNNHDVSVSRENQDFFVPVTSIEELEQLRPFEGEFLRGEVLHATREGLTNAREEDPFETKWEAYREALQLGKPYKRVADYYIFTKR